MVEKLRLLSKNNRFPYKLTSLKRANDIKVTKRFLDEFSIVKKDHDKVNVC